MNGIKYLLDTHTIIGVLKGNEQAIRLTELEEQTIKALLSRMTHLTLDAAVIIAGIM